MQCLISGAYTQGRPRERADSASIIISGAFLHMNIYCCSHCRYKVTNYEDQESILSVYHRSYMQLHWGFFTRILLCLQYESNCIMRLAKLLSESLYYKTCHTNSSKTRLEYRTYQLSIEVTMTSFLLWVLTEVLRQGWNRKPWTFLLKGQVGIKGLWEKFNLSLIRVPWLLVFRTKE